MNLALSQKHYREVGLKLTPQLTAILAYLKGNIRHPSAAVERTEKLKDKGWRKAKNTA